SWQDPTKSRAASLTLITSAQSPERPKSARGFFYAHSQKELTDTETSNPHGWTYPRRSEGDSSKMFRARRDIKKQTVQRDAGEPADTAAMSPTRSERAILEMFRATARHRKNNSLRRISRAHRPTNSTRSEAHSKTYYEPSLTCWAESRVKIKSSADACSWGAFKTSAPNLRAQ